MHYVHILLIFLVIVYYVVNHFISYHALHTHHSHKQYSSSFLIWHNKHESKYYIITYDSIITTYPYQLDKSHNHVLSTYSIYKYTKTVLLTVIMASKLIYCPGPYSRLASPVPIKLIEIKLLYLWFSCSRCICNAIMSLLKFFGKCKLPKWICLAWNPSYTCP